MTKDGDSTISVGVMGAGAVGSYFGTMLARAGVPVTLVGRPAHVEAITRAGLEFTSAGQTAHMPLAASADMAALREADVVLVCVKAGDTEATAAALGRTLPPDTLLVSMQNGVDNAWRMSASVINPVVPAAVYVSVEMTGPGQLRHNGGGSLVLGRPLHSGTPSASADATFDAFVTALGRAGVPCRESADIRVDLWTKLTANCAYNALSALTQLRYRHIATDQGTRDVMRMVTEENAAVALAEGVPVTVEALDEAVRRIVEVMPEALSSTAQDLLLGRRTEIDALNGFVVRRGQALGVPTPVNRTLQALVSLVERSQVSAV
jgi:2-dehydropantoate 2-reductase